jgi:hypothetical protein
MDQIKSLKLLPWELRFIDRTKTDKQLNLFILENYCLFEENRKKNYMRKIACFLKIFLQMSEKSMFCCSVPFDLVESIWNY